MSRATKVSVQSADPNYPKDADKVTKTVTKQGTNDTMVVAAWETGNPTTLNAVVVLKVSSAANPTATIDGSGNVTVTGSGTGKTNYLLIEINSADPLNWTVNLNTNGGSGYNFRKGNGGSGRK